MFVFKGNKVFENFYCFHFILWTCVSILYLKQGIYHKKNASSIFVKAAWSDLLTTRLVWAANHARFTDALLRTVHTGLLLSTLQMEMQP